METGSEQQEAMKPSKPQKEHQWLQQLVGEWVMEAEMDMGPESPPQKSTGAESVRSWDGLWVLAEGEGETPGGDVGRSLMTLGYDPDRERFVGTWISSMMAFMWVYEGELDAAERVLTLNAEGPDMAIEGKTARYRDVIEIKSDDHRVMSSSMQDDEGNWTQFMEAHFRRK